MLLTLLSNHFRDKAKSRPESLRSTLTYTMANHDHQHLNSITLPSFAEPRGTLTLVDLLQQKEALPFDVQRIFWITGVPKGATRGAHAHQHCWEALVAVSGSFKLKVSNGHDAPWTEVIDSPDKAIVVPPRVWCELYDFAPGTVCLCLASGHYDECGYLKDFDEFVDFVNDSER